MRINRICACIATLGPVGYLPAPGTVASILTAVAIYFLQPTQPFFFIGFLILLILSYYTIAYALPLFKEEDPSCIVIDEVVGYCVTLLYPGFTDSEFIVVGLVLFRFFDIVKPFPVSWAERLPGAYGVLVDDIVAGVLAAITLLIPLLLVTLMSVKVYFFGI